MPPPGKKTSLAKKGASQEVEELALEERLREGALVVEWPEIGAQILPEDVLFLKLTNGDHEEQRVITFTATGPRSAGLLSRSAAVFEALDATVGLESSAQQERPDK